ncbi:Yhc1p, partial [Ascoidea rubescens DSM 1968]
MPKYYCDYCRIYLTHDSASVRKSHFIGKNHIKYVCDYYEQEAKKLGIWNPENIINEYKIEDYYKGCPTIKNSLDDFDLVSGSSRKANAGNNNLSDTNHVSSSSKNKSENLVNGNDINEIENKVLPPPPTLPNMPNPPSSAYN